MASLEKRTNGDGSVSWRVRWREGEDRFSQTFPTRAQAVTFRGQVDAAGGWPAEWLATDTEEPTFAQWAERAIAARSGVTERTRHDARRDLRLHIEPTFGDQRLSQISRESVARWVNDLAASGMAPKTIRNVHGLASSIMAEAQADGVTDRNPFRGTRLPRVDHVDEEMTFLTPQELGMLVEVVPAHYRDLVQFLAGTGLRFGEATAVRVRDVDVLGGRLTVAQAWKRQPDSTFTLGPPKTARSRRTISLSRSLQELLIPHVTGKPDDLVFTTPRGEPVRHSNFHQRVWVRSVGRANDPSREGPDEMAVLGKRPRIHDLRHSHASWLIAANVPLPKIQRRLGHENISTTIDRYGHLMPELDDVVDVAIDAALGSASESGGEPLEALPLLDGQGIQAH